MHDQPVTEHIVLDVSDGPAFEAAFASAVRHIEASPGCRGATLRRCVETADRYLLLVAWDTLEAHTVEFRGSPAFTAWRAEVGDLFTAPPLVEHYVDVP